MKKARPYIAYRKVYTWLTKYVVLLFICVLFGLCGVYIYCFFSQSSVVEVNLNEPIQIHQKPAKRIFEGKKYVHIDLKGAPPKVSYYEYLFPLLASVGADGIVIEYEDMFPYYETLVNISALNAYTYKDIKLINKLAKTNGLEVIPLVQTLGHLESVLKLEEFKDLREVPEYPQVLCPSNKNSLEVITEMISQIVEAHPDSSKIHIGANEVEHLGRCQLCKKRMQTSKISKQDLFFKHIGNIHDFIKQKYPRMSILMWDGQLRYITEEDMLSGWTDIEVTPVVWQNDVDVFDKLGPSVWNHYAKFFSHIWIASAFKGATGVNQYIVETVHYIQNRRSWISVLESYNYLLDFEAIILTGQQRYDHFSILCELLPVALPSLIINLKMLEAKEDASLSPPKEVSDILKCQQPYALMGPAYGTPQCVFLGSNILENVYRFHQLNQDFEQLEKTEVVKGWMTSFSVLHNLSNRENMLRISSQLNHHWEEVKQIEREMSEALLDVYDAFTMHEWMSTYFEPLKKKIYDLWDAKERILPKKVWPRRPFNN